MQSVVCPGSFDPLHNGHIEIIARAANLFDEVIVAVAANPEKTSLFSVTERIEMARETFAVLRGVNVRPMEPGMLLVDFCKNIGAHAVVKGLRGVHDYPYESAMATMNRHLTGLETVFLSADGRYSHLSSSLIKQIHSLNGDISEFVPGTVARRLDHISPSRKTG